MPPTSLASSTRPKLVPMLSLKQFADLVGVSTKTVGRWVKSGDLRTHRLGRQLRVDEDDARIFIALRRR